MLGLIGAAAIGLLVGLSLAYYNVNKAKPEEEKESWEKALKFDNYRKAADFRSRLKDFVSQYGTLSVFDLCKLREMSESTSDTYSVSWEMDSYGWTEKMIAHEATIALGTILLPKPVSLR